MEIFRRKKKTEANLVTERSAHARSGKMKRRGERHVARFLKGASTARRRKGRGTSEIRPLTPGFLPPPTYPLSKTKNKGGAAETCGGPEKERDRPNRQSRRVRAGEIRGGKETRPRERGKKSAPDREGEKKSKLPTRTAPCVGSSVERKGGGGGKKKKNRVETGGKK